MDRRTHAVVPLATILLTPLLAGCMNAVACPVQGPSATGSGDELNERENGHAFDLYSVNDAGRDLCLRVRVVAGDTAEEVTLSHTAKEYTPNFERVMEGYIDGDHARVEARELNENLHANATFNLTPENRIVVRTWDQGENPEGRLTLHHYEFPVSFE